MKATLFGIPYQDLGGPTGLPEDERIGVIVRAVRQGHTVGVLVDDQPGVADRYRAKLQMFGCRVGDPVKGPTRGVVTMQVSPKPS